MACSSSVMNFPFSVVSIHFFFNDTATTEIYTLSLHDALPISARSLHTAGSASRAGCAWTRPGGDRKSTRLNSSHLGMSYTVLCLKKKQSLTIMKISEIQYLHYPCSRDV